MNIGKGHYFFVETTEAIRRTIQNSEKSIAKLAEELSLNPKTVLKMEKRRFLHDMPMGPKQVHSTVLSKKEKALTVAFRKEFRNLYNNISIKQFSQSTHKRVRLIEVDASDDLKIAL